MAQNSLLNLVHDELGKGVVLTMKNESDVLSTIDFKQIQSNMYSYNVSDVLPSVCFRALGENPDALELVTGVEKEELTILFGDVKTDRALGAYQNINDVRAEQTIAAAVALAQKYEECFFYGKGDSKNFKGLEARLKDRKGTKVVGAITGADADADAELELLYKLVDAVHGRPDVLYLNKSTRRSINKLMRKTGITTGSVERFGKQVESFDGVPMVVTEQVKNGDIFAVKYGQEFVQGLTINGIQTQEAESQGVFLRTKVEGYMGLMTAHPKSFAMLTSK